jgi:hypothetical protein
MHLNDLNTATAQFLNNSGSNGVLVLVPVPLLAIYCFTSGKW